MSSAPVSDQEGATTRPWWRTSDWWYLSYLVLLLFPLAFNPEAGAFHWAGTGVVVALFLPLFVLAARGDERMRRRCTLATTLLGIAAVWVNSGASVLFVYAAAWAGTFTPRRFAQRSLLVLTGVLVLLTAISPVPLPYRLWAFLPAIIFVWIVGVATMEDADRLHEQQQLRIDNARIIHGQTQQMTRIIRQLLDFSRRKALAPEPTNLRALIESATHLLEHLATASERERIARDLHDLLGHSLTSVVVRAQLVQRLAGDDPERAAAEGAEIERTARDALANVRATVAGWRNASLDDELEAAHAALAAAEISLHVDRDPAVQPAPTVEAALALSLREAITNVVRHAGATEVTVTIGVVDGEIALRVADDGRGGNAPEGGGLSGMRDRIAALGGRVERAVRTGGSQGGSGPPLGTGGSQGGSGPLGTGTTLTVSVPLEVAG